MMMLLVLVSPVNKLECVRSITHCYTGHLGTHDVCQNLPSEEAYFLQLPTLKVHLVIPAYHLNISEDM